MTRVKGRSAHLTPRAAGMEQREKVEQCIARRGADNLRALVDVALETGVPLSTVVAIEAAMSDGYGYNEEEA